MQYPATDLLFLKRRTPGHRDFQLIDDVGLVQQDLQALVHPRLHAEKQGTCASGRAALGEILHSRQAPQAPSPRPAAGSYRTFSSAFAIKPTSILTIIIPITKA